MNTMKKSLAAALCATLALGAAAPAFAGGGGCPPGLAKQGRCGEKGYDDHRRDGRHDDRYDRRDDYRHETRHEWRRGERIDDRTHVVVIEHWRDRGLPQPPRGHRYVQVDGEILLIAAATNLIVDVLANR